MAGWLHKPRRPELDEERIGRRDEVESLLPASIRHPEANRFTPLGSDFEGDGEENDQDIEFFESLVRAVEGDAPAPAGGPAPTPMMVHTPAPRRLIPQPQEDELSLFREVQVDRAERSGAEAHFVVEDVDMGDLLDELSTTAAALRRRKAA